MAITPSVPNKTNIVLGDGVLYKDYAQGTQLTIGACRGDSVFNVDRQFREQEYNGSYGPTETLKVKTKVIVTMKIALLELSTTNFTHLFQGFAKTDQTTYYELKESVDIADGDYWTNMAFVGQRADGKNIIIIMENVLGDGALNMAFKTKDDVVVDTMLTAHYGTATPTTPPYEIRYYVA
jgi:hypothetical protein